MKNRLIILIVASIFTLSHVLSPDKVFAGGIDYSSNDILFYNPEDSGCISSSYAAKSSSSSTDNQKTTALFLTSTNFSDNDNKPMNAVQMAAIMGNIQQESGFNPKAGEGKSYIGLVQWSSPGRWDNISDPKTDLDNQLDFIKKELDGAYKGKLDEFWSSSTPEDLEKATYAITRNYEVAVSSGKDKSSTTWTNNKDAIDNVQDWEKRISYANGFYDKYGNLAASGSGYRPGDGCGELISGGMTLEQAKDFMKEYKSLEPKDWPEGTPGTKYDINGTTCAGGSLANCVAFSQYFVNRYTNKKLNSPGNGEHVVGNLLSIGFEDGGHTPRVYSVFSETSSSNNSYGHTGVVLGINKDSDEIIIGEAGCGLGFDWIDARRYSLSQFSSDRYTYAYVNDMSGDIGKDDKSKEDKK